jgi:integrase
VPSNVYRRPDGRWHARLRGKHLGYHETQEAAQEAVERARGTGTLQASTVALWAGLWPSLYPGRRNEETEAHNAEMVAPFVRAHGPRNLAAVTRLDAQAWAVAHPGHVRYLRLMFGKAVRAGLLDENVWDYVEAQGRSKTPRVPPTPEELARLEQAARARGWSHFADLVVFTAYTGLRLQEVSGVQTKDVLESGRRVVVSGKRRAGQADPPVRTVAVFGPGQAALGRQLPEVGRVWRSPSGRALNRDSVGRQFRAVREDAGYTGSFHGLRHYCASWLLDRGASREDVAVQLGHMDEAGHVDTTQVQRTYGHYSPAAALVRLEALAG